MTTEQLRARREELLAQQERLNIELEQLEAEANETLEADQSKFVDDMLEEWKSYGWPEQALLERLHAACPDALPEKPRRKPKPRRSNGNGASHKVQTWVNPDDESQIYHGRGIPNWVKEHMAAKGYDFTSKEDRAAYRDNCLERRG